MTTPTTTTEPTTTAAPTTTTALGTTTTLLTTTTVEPTTGPTTTGPTTTQSATTTTAPVILGGSQPAGVSAMTVGGLLPLLGLLYLLRGLLSRPGGTHAKRRHANRLRRD